jgi:hypothetical protein
MNSQAPGLRVLINKNKIHLIMYIKYLLPFFLSFFLTTTIFAQKGFIRGTVIDESLGEPMMSVTVLVEGTNTGTLTDLDGKFSISIEPGTYNLRLSFVSFENKVISGIKVTAGQATVLDELSMKESSLNLSEVVVTASMVRNTETSMLAMKMNSPTVIDGISAVNFKKIGDSDAASSMKRVTGVSVEGGKYVYVRGLGDRYTKTMMNGVDIPGLDPDRNTMQMDIFPTSVIDNIMVYKSFSPELPADFTGGVVDIALRDFPDQKKMNLNMSAAYNPDFHFRSGYLGYEGGKTDFLGFDDGTRAIPATENIPFFTSVFSDPEGADAQRYRDILQGFNPVMSAARQNSFMDYSLGFTAGNQLPIKKATLGYNFGIGYKSNTEFYKNAEYGRYGMSSDPDISDLEVREFQIGDFGVNSVLVSGLAGVALKTQKSKYRLNLIHLQNGESKAGIFDYTGSDQGSNFTGYQHNLEYGQRSLSNILLEGKHTLSDAKWDIVWKLSPTISSISDPDTRFVRYVTTDGLFQINTEGGFPERIWRNLSEINLAGVISLSREFMFNGKKAKINFGGGYTYKNRDFMIRKFALNIRNLPLSGDPDELFRPENLWPLNGTGYTSGTTYEANFVPENPNQFDATSKNAAGYFLAEINILKNLKAVAGVRAEYFRQWYTGQDQLGINVLDNDLLINDFDLFPSVNLILSLSEKQNIRVSYARTIARPSFKEMSYAEISDPLSGRTFIGGLFRDANDVAGIEYWDGNLRSTYVDNFDIRWELYQANGQMLSLSGFYKRFIDPIEIVQYASQTGAFQPRNVGEGRVAGVEIELRQSLGIVAGFLENFSVSANASVTSSEIELSTTELLSRTENARTGQTIFSTRVMAGQAPYILNAGFNYNGGQNGIFEGLEAGLYYNVQGITLQYVGIADLPDIYTLPFHSLNLNINKTLGRNKKTQVGFKVENILNDKKESVFRSFNVTDPFFTKLEPGITFQFRLGYSIF